MILVTGGAGFIGSNFVLNWLSEIKEPIVNVDKLTYAGNLSNLALVEKVNHYFIRGDICDKELLLAILKKYQPRAIIHFAAESHVDRSIHGPSEFIKTNIEGTFNLLEISRNYWTNLTGEGKKNFRFLHVSTDEVFGSLSYSDSPFTEKSPYLPNSPYSASKASSDHLVRAWFHTYGLPILIGNCSNNYGPFQFPEKLIPLMILNALSGKKLPIYGDGKQIRDWLYVIDHCNALQKILFEGIPGETYNIGGQNEKTNLSVVIKICDLLDKLSPGKNSYKDQIIFIKDRPGHDIRYAINSKKIVDKLNWVPKENFDTGIEKTVNWYLQNKQWINKIISGDYLKWMDKNYESDSIGGF